MDVLTKWPRRFGILTALTGLLSALVIATVPQAAHADTYPHCPEHPQLGDSHVIQGKWLFVFWVKFWEPTFNKGEGAVLSNETDAQAMRTATVTVEHTSTITTTESTSTSIMAAGINRSNKVDRTVTETLRISKTVSDQFLIPARTSTQADYGVYARNVLIDLDVWELAGGRCWFYPEFSPRNKLINAPVDEGWRLQNYPRINPGGVVNGVDYSYNIHPGTVVAIFGTNFRQPDKVIVRQNFRLWEIQFGSPWWYDSPQQINATLPGDLQAGWATVAVRAGNGLESLNPESVFIS